MIDLSRPVNLSAPDFVNNKFEWFERIREERPVHRAKVSILTVYTLARYEDCTNILNDPRVLRNRTTATGGRRFPFPMPNSIKPIAESMIQEDDPNHRRLRELVRRGFRPQAIAQLEARIDEYSRELRSLFADLPSTVRFVRDLVRDKRNKPGDDILTGLIEAEDQGDRLSEDELVAMVFLLIIAGFETTVHLISNGVITLLEHPEQLARLQAHPNLIDSAVEEILRHRGPVQSTKPGYASEDITLHGITIPKGKPIMPLFGAANHDPRAFDAPQDFDICRTPNRHLGFGHGVHYCLGAHLARAETRLALSNLFERFPDLQLAVDQSALTLERLPGWHRYSSVPVVTAQLRQAA